MGLRLSANKENRISSVLRFLEHLSVIRCYPIPILFRYRKDGKIIWREANPKASRCLDPGTKLKNPRGIIILLGDIFLMLGHIFSLYAAPPFCPPHHPKSLEPRPKFACRPKIFQNKNFIFVAKSRNAASHKKGQPHRAALLST